jgi:glutamate-1-semialdehyde 2,1-aminomutase
MSARCARLVAGLNEAGKAAGVAFCAQSQWGHGRLLHAGRTAVSFAQVQAQDVERFKRFYHLMLDQGVYLPPSPVEAFFFSSAHSDADIEATLAAARKALAAVA